MTTAGGYSTPSDSPAGFRGLRGGGGRRREREGRDKERRKKEELLCTLNRNCIT